MSTCGAGLGQGQGTGFAYHAVSADGSRVIFTAPDPAANGQGAGCWNEQREQETGKPVDPPQLYMRLGERVLDLSSSELGRRSRILRRRSRAPLKTTRRVFFLSEAWLTAHHPLAHDLELYEWRAEGVAGPAGACASADGCLTLISGGEPGSEAQTQGAHVFAVTAVANEGAAVYLPGVRGARQGSPDTGSKKTRQDAPRRSTSTAMTPRRAPRAMWPPSTTRDYSNSGCEDPIYNGAVRRTELVYDA